MHRLANSDTEIPKRQSPPEVEPPHDPKPSPPPEEVPFVPEQPQPQPAPEVPRPAEPPPQSPTRNTLARTVEAPS